MGYVHGRTVNTPAVALRTADEIRAELDRLNRVRAAIITETAAKEAELVRIRAARSRLRPVATYAPTPEQLAYRDQWAPIIAQQPAPKHGGWKGLQLATREASGHDRHHS